MPEDLKSNIFVDESLTDVQLSSLDSVFGLFLKNGRQKQGKLFISKNDLKGLITDNQLKQSLAFAISKKYVQELNLEGIIYYYVPVDYIKQYKEYKGTLNDRPGDKSVDAGEDTPLDNTSSQSAVTGFEDYKAMDLKVLMGVSIGAFIINFALYFMGNVFASLIFGFLGILAFVYSFILLFMKPYKPVLKQKPNNIYYMTSLILSLITTVFTGFAFVMASDSLTDMMVESELGGYVASGNIMQLYNSLGFTTLNEDSFLVLVEPLVIDKIEGDQMEATSSVAIMNLEDEDINVSFKLQAIDLDGNALGDPLSFDNIYLDPFETTVLDGYSISTSNPDSMNLVEPGVSYILLDVEENY